MDEIRPFSETISTGEEEAPVKHSEVDSFVQLPAIVRKQLAKKWALVQSSEKELKEGYERIEAEWDVTRREIDGIVEMLLNGKQDVPKNDQEILHLGWPKVFEFQEAEKNNETLQAKPPLNPIIPKGDYYHPKKGWY